MIITLNAICIVAAFVCFLLAAFGVQVGSRTNLSLLGMALFVLSFL